MSGDKNSTSSCVNLEARVEYLERVYEDNALKIQTLQRELADHNQGMHNLNVMLSTILTQIKVDGLRCFTDKEINYMIACQIKQQELPSIEVTMRKD